MLAQAELSLHVSLILRLAELLLTPPSKDPMQHDGRGLSMVRLILGTPVIAGQNAVTYTSSCQPASGHDSKLSAGRSGALRP